MHLCPLPQQSHDIVTTDSSKYTCTFPDHELNFSHGGSELLCKSSFLILERNWNLLKQPALPVLPGDIKLFKLSLISTTVCLACLLCIGQFLETAVLSSLNIQGSKRAQAPFIACMWILLSIRVCTAAIPFTTFTFSPAYCFMLLQQCQ